MTRFHMHHISLAIALIGCTCAWAIAQTDETTNGVAPQASFEQLESDSLEFMQEHHPELVSLIKSLKSMRQKEYETAIREISRIKRRLENLSKREPDLYGLELEAWKTKSKIDLMIAKGMARDQSFDKEKLRELLKVQVENQKKRWKHEQASISKRQSQLSDLLSKMNGHEEEKVEQQLTIHLKNLEAKLGKNKKPKSENQPAKADKP